MTKEHLPPIQKLSKMEQATRVHQLGEMAAALAHELNQPLAAIMYTLSGAVRRARGGELNNAQMLDVLEAAIAHTHRAAQIVARVREPLIQQAQAKTRVCMNEVVREMVKLSYACNDNNAVLLLEELAPALPRVPGDRVQLEQVVLNLLSNAIHAACQTRSRDGRVLVRTNSDGEAVEISVWDNGPGLDPAKRQRMFEPFFSTRRDGIGLGLTICQSIVENHGGHIWAEPLSEGGLQLRVRLPVVTREAP